jgi:outer membrane lipoprotein-sorting protein
MLRTTKLSTFEKHFIKHYGIEIQTVDNVWNFLKLKLYEKDNPYELELKVTKLINNVGISAIPFQFEAK